MADPYAEFQQPAAQGNPYAEFLAPVGEQPKSDNGTDWVAAIGHGLQSGLTLGAQPKIEAAITAGLGKLAGEGNFGDIYKHELEKNRAEVEKSREAHPILEGAGQFAGSLPAFAATAPEAAAAGLGKWALQGAGLGALQGAAESKNVLGEQAVLAPKAALDVGLGAAGGAAGGALGYGVGKGATSFLGNRADKKALDAIGANTVGAREQIKGLLQTIGITEPGQFAKMARESGVVGGFRGLGSVRAAAEATKGGGINAFKDLIGKATATGKTLGVNDLIQHLETNAGDALSGIGATKGAQELSQNAVAKLATQGIANRSGQPFDVVAKLVSDQPELLANSQGNISFTHEQLQDVLKGLSKQSLLWRKKLSAGTISEDELGRLHVYDALRSFQDKGLEEAVGASGRTARQTIALNSSIERISGHRETALEGQKKIGLQSALWGGTIGGTLSALGLPQAGLPIMLAGLLEKSTAPLRANVLTSLLSKAQVVPRAIGQTGMIPMAMGRVAVPTIARQFTPEDEESKPALEDLQKLLAKGKP